MRTSGRTGVAAPAPLTVVSAVAEPVAAAAFAESLAEAGWPAAAWEDREGGPSRVEIFLEDASRAAEAAAALVACGAAAGVAVEPRTDLLPAEDWAESWKRFFHPIRVSPRLVVCPPWELPPDAAPGTRVVVDPGMSFGTGQHATTRGCLALLDAIAQRGGTERSVLDVGCGSGILAIAARRLGFRDVRGCDNDPDAVRNAGENAALNGLSIPFAVCDLAALDARAEIVLANILAPVLVAHAARLAAALDRARPAASALVLSGILDSQYPLVRETYTALGLHERISRLDGEWRSGWFETVP